MRFDYMRDTAPDAIDRIRAFRVSAPFQAPLAALATAVAVLASAWGIEACRLREASSVDRLAAIRLQQSRASLAQAKLARTQVERMLQLDNRLRDIRLSGAFVAQRLAGIGRHMPERAWLTSITRQQGTVDINGRAEGLDVVSEAISDLMSGKGVKAATLMHAGEDERSSRSRILTFEMSLRDSGR